MVARYVAAAIAAGRRRLDFLRGDESYKYEWGAVDEPIERILVSRDRPAHASASPTAMTVPAADDPCVQPVVRLRAAGSPRVRVVEILATGTNGGAQEHLYGLRRADGSRALRRQRRRPVERQRDPQDRPARGPGPRHRRARRRPRRRAPRRAPRGARSRRSSTSTCTGPRWSARARSCAWPSAATRGRTSCRPSTRRGSARARIARPLRELTPSMDRLIAVSRAIVAKIAEERGGLAPVEPRLQRRRPRALRPPGAVLHAPRGVRHGAGRPDRRRRRPARAGEGPPDAPRGLAGRAARLPAARTCSSSARAAGATPSRPRRASSGSPTGSSSPAAATTSRR